MECFHRWRNWIRPFVISMYFLSLVVAIPLCVWELNRVDAPKHVVAWFVGGIFVLMALPISFWGILQHLVYYTQPQLQRHIIRVLWMVPIYALNAWLGLRFPEAAIYLDTLRECYEAYVIYNFMSYLLLYLLTEHPDLDLILEVKPSVKHIIPFCCLPNWHLGGSFIQRCKHGVLQYTIVRPTTTIIALICQLAGVYEEGDFNFKSAWSYIVIINNISQVWAMYCLVMFYRGTKEELKPINPIPKFMCVKAVVFLSFWQAVVIAALVKLGAIPVDGVWDFYHDIKDVATGLQDFLICIEMFLASIAHYFSFSHKPFMEGAADQGHCCSSFMSMWDVSDVRDDVVEHVKYLGKNVKKTVTRNRENQFYTKEDRNRERIPLLQYGSEIHGNSTVPYGLQSEQYSGGTFDSSPAPIDTIAEINDETLVKQRLDNSTSQQSTMKDRHSKHGDVMNEQLESDYEQGHDLLDSFESSTDVGRTGVNIFDKSVSMSMNNYFEGSVSVTHPEDVLEPRTFDGSSLAEGSTDPTDNSQNPSDAQT